MPISRHRLATDLPILPLKANFSFQWCISGFRRSSDLFGLRGGSITMEVPWRGADGPLGPPLVIDIQTKVDHLYTTSGQTSRSRDFPNRYESENKVEWSSFILFVKRLGILFAIVVGINQISPFHWPFLILNADRKIENRSNPGAVGRRLAVGALSS